MGLAASQARLLSITSRMSDNELRSQLINNAKMRLTTDSARVSDEYVAALNATQLMFQNFDTQGNEVYQALTFNSLTAYSAYNNQYGVVNSSGEILVSATDAANFKTANGSLEKFLELYDLEQTTDYFETMKNSEEYAKNGVGYYDSHNKWQPFETTPEELQAIHEGITDANGVTHYGKENSLNSLEYGDYEVLVDDYNAAKDKYKTQIDESMKNFLKGEKEVIPGNKFTDRNGKTFESRYADVMRYYDSNGTNGNLNDLINSFVDFANNVGILPDMSDIDKSAPASKQLMKDFYNPDYPDPSFNKALLEILKVNLATASSSVGTKMTLNYFEQNGTTRWAKINKASGALEGTIGPTQTGYLTAPGSGTTDYTGYGSADFVTTNPPGTQAVSVMPNVADDDNYRYEMMYSYTDENGAIQYTYPSAADYSDISSKYELTACSGPVARFEETEITQEDICEAIKYLYESFRNSILSNISSKPFEDNDADLIAARNEYYAAATKLAKFIYGDANGQAVIDEMTTNATYKELNMIDYLDQPSWVLSQNTTDPMVGYDLNEDGVIDPKTEMELGKIDVTHYNPFYNKYPTTTAAPDPATSDLGDSGKSYTVNYQVVKDLFLMDCMMEHYGEPTYTWLDKNNKDENGQAKATWYSNLFARMEKGYKTLGDGLGNNQEWLQFAFESGLVHMEQVNKSSEWVSTMYSNCSAITESTVDIDITLAEAKYKREMAKIEAKDKKYDIELKNIDTEHESLKTEYDSIKEVMKANIDRNFKMFQA